MQNYNGFDQFMILKKISEIVLEDNPTPRTQTVRFSVIKKMFRDVTNNEKFLDKIKPKNSVTDFVMKENQMIRDNKVLMTITKEMVEKIMILEKSQNVHEMCIYLLFVSGRRVSELIDSQFNQDWGTDLVRITGTKKRTDNVDCYFLTLVDKWKFLDIFEKFKEIFGDVGKNSFHRTLSRKVKRIFGVHFKPHMLRGMYVTYAFKFRNDEQLKINTFIKENLCHQSIHSSLNYTGYKIDDQFTHDFVK